MRQITAFNFLTLNGFYKGPNDDISWHIHGAEGNAYSEEKLARGNILLFGRKTYEMMYGFWPTPMAHQLYPKVAEQMNAAEKIVLSNTLTTLEWHNTRLLKGDTTEQIRQLKSTPGKNISILGSGSVITQLTEAGLIDTYELMIDPLAIGQGTAFLANITQPLQLKLTGTRVFEASGTVILIYERI